MLNFRNTNLIFFILLVGIAVTDYYYHVSPWVYVTLAFIYSLILFYGSYYVGSNFFMKVLCACNTTQKKIAISFDDGPAMSFTPEILEILREKNVAATFFCI
ncbi:MAG: polysaccharide deacetylase family protein, partial [Gemmatimonadaceae bacterium]|nr:polysaccharide deacetylase family protein [Chitinophagaceae bacterium]